MVANNQEKAFKDLIKSTGYESAPQSIIPSVMKQLEADMQLGKQNEKSLIPKWILVLIPVLIFSYLVYAFSVTPDFKMNFLADLIQLPDLSTISINWVPDLNIGTMLLRIALIICVAILIQFYFIKNYYERRI